MTLSSKLHVPIKWIVSLSVMLLFAGSAFAQDHQRAAAIAAIGSFFLFFWIILLALYVYTALAVQTIAQKTNTANPWLAWIPIVNIVLLLNIAKKPIWWIILCLIPFVNIIVIIIVWMAVAEARNKPSW